MAETQHQISRELLGKIVDEVFDGAIEDASVIEQIYTAIKKHETPAPSDQVTGWQAMATAPLDKTPVIIAVPTEHRDDWIIGEAYHDPEHYEGGDWWWAGTRHDGYDAGPISDCNHHAPEYWQPMPPIPPTNVEPEPDAVEQSYRNGFIDGGKEFADNLQHSQETVRGLQRILEELSEKQISKAVIDVIKERRRQMAVEGWTIEHDDQHQQSELAWAAACYALAGAPGNPAATVISQKDIPHALWPWALQWFKPTDRRRDLEKAGALIIAEIERFDRAAASEGE